MITDTDIKESALIIGCDEAAIRAVKEVESGGEGMLPDGKVKILFEPHVFWKQLKFLGVNPQELVDKDASLKDILYPIWKSGAYGKVSAQHSRLDRAIKINREAALKSASWGLFQILGLNFKKAGCCDVEEFVSKNISGEPAQLKLFLTYIRNTGLDDELRAHDWAGFAYQYNGSLYRKNNYDGKLKAAWIKFKSIA